MWEELGKTDGQRDKLTEIINILHFLLENVKKWLIFLKVITSAIIYSVYEQLISRTSINYHKQVKKK